MRDWVCGFNDANAVWLSSAWMMEHRDEVEAWCDAQGCHFDPVVGYINLINEQNRTLWVLTWS